MEKLKELLDLSPRDIMQLIFAIFMTVLWIAGKISDRRHKREMHRLKLERDALLAELAKLHHSKSELPRTE